ncbi:MAG: hypothetical protein H7318_01435 [Oligoflexus sp.]|nr:hypothetical protein [Oligoflexus sp.]
MVNGLLEQDHSLHAPPLRYKIVFEDDAKSGTPHWRDFLGGWLCAVENAPEIGARVECDALEQKDLFWVNNYCRHMVCFDQRPFIFQSID